MTKIVLYGALFGVISLSAQDATDQNALVKAKLEKALAETRAVGFISGEMVTGKTVKGSPYSAEAVNETVQTLADGNRITRTHSTMLYRDSEGRERREESIGDVGNWESRGEPAKAVFISDPVEGVQYTLEPHSKTARKVTRTVISGGGRGGAGGAVAVFTTTQDRTVTVNAGVGTGSGEGVGFSTFSVRTDGREEQNTKVENLGTQVIEGVSAEGTRTTTTIPANQIGNEQPILVVSERWFSPDLKVLVMSKRSDPRMGTTTYKLTNVNRSEPSPSMFQVPPDYTVRSVGGDLRRININPINPEQQQ